MKRVVRAVAAVVIAGGAVAGTGLPAQAAWVSCTETGQGTLCADVVNGHDYRATYNKRSGGSEYVDFNLICTGGTWFGDGGAFTIYAGQERGYIFTVGYQGPCYVTMWNRAGSGSWSTGLIQP
jgi:hypothetical protein